MYTMRIRASICSDATATAMTPQERAALLQQMERSGYLPTLRAYAKSSSAPFWWYVDDGTVNPAAIKHNGTICFVHTGERVLGVTADHVYRGYLLDLQSDGVVCQIGNIRFQPEQRLISSDERVDLATFDIPELVVAAAGCHLHHPSQWPTPPLAEGELVIAGGYPGPIREERLTVAEFPFVSLATRVRQAGNEHSALQLELADSMWGTTERLWPGADLGGMSGGPVFRVHSGGIEHLELAGFIYEYGMDYEIIRARQSAQVAVDGTVLPLMAE